MNPSYQGKYYDGIVTNFLSHKPGKAQLSSGNDSEMENIVMLADTFLVDILNFHNLFFQT